MQVYSQPVCALSLDLGCATSTSTLKLFEKMGNANSGLDFTPNDDITGSFLNAHLQPWKVFNGVAKKDASPVAIFSVDKKQATASHVSLAQNCVKKIKTLKHPFVLRVLVCAILSDFWLPPHT